MSEAILFSRCLGLNDAKSTTAPVTHPYPRDKEAGDTELIGCLNVTTTSDGALENIPELVSVFTHAAPVMNISAGDRFFYQDGTDTYEWDGTNLFQRGIILDGPICHTPLDVRVSTVSQVYKSLPLTAFQAATVGTNPNPATSKPFYAMPAYAGAWLYNAKLYAINAADPRFLQYSEDYLYDLWALGDNFIPHRWPILSGGAINAADPNKPGGVCLLHADSVTILTGSGPLDFKTNNFPVAPLAGTLFSGFISKTQGVGHVFLAADGVYLVDEDGKLANLTGAQLNFLNTLNDSYAGAIVANGKYLAWGNHVCVEYDFVTKSVLLRASNVASATTWRSAPYLAVGPTISTFADSSSAVASMVRLPFSDLGQPGAKYLEALYFTGEINGETTVTAFDDTGQYWEVRAEVFGKVNNYRIKTPRGKLGAKVSFQIECASGPFRMEHLRAVFSTSQRSR